MARHRRKAKHRVVPKPEWYDKTKPGTCRWCNEEIIEGGAKNTRKSWHKECVDAYFSMISPRKAVMLRDKGVCAICNKQVFFWEADHIRPLSEAKGRIEFWHLTNIRTLCRPCHKEKTATDNARLREEKKLRKKEKPKKGRRGGSKPKT